jgi:hypothetical protein
MERSTESVGQEEKKFTSPQDELRHTSAPWALPGRRIQSTVPGRLSTECTAEDTSSRLGMIAIEAPTTGADLVSVCLGHS